MVCFRVIAAVFLLRPYFILIIDWLSFCLYSEEKELLRENGKPKVEVIDDRWGWLRVFFGTSGHESNTVVFPKYFTNNVFDDSFQVEKRHEDNVRRQELNGENDIRWKGLSRVVPVRQRSPRKRRDKSFNGLKRRLKATRPKIFSSFRVTEKKD